MYFLQDEHIGLRSLDSKDLDGDYVNWLNDAEVCAGNSHHVYPYTRAKGESYIASNRDADDRLVLAIDDLSTGKHVGNVSLQEISWINRSAEFAILVGSGDHRGKGVGRRAGSLLIAHGFNQLNLHRIHCGTYANNIAMQRLAVSLGMSECGRLTEAAYKNGEYLDVILYELLLSDGQRSGG